MGPSGKLFLASIQECALTGLEQPISKGSAASAVANQPGKLDLVRIVSICFYLSVLIEFH